MKKNKHKEIFKIIKKFLIKNDSFFLFFHRNHGDMYIGSEVNIHIIPPFS